MADEYGNDFPQISPVSGDAWNEPAQLPPTNASEAQRTFANSSSFFSVKGKIVTEDVYFPEKNQWLRFKAITQAEFRRAQSFCQAYDERTKQRTPDRDKDINIAVLIMGAINDDGGNVFELNSHTYRQFLAEPYSVVNRGSEIVARISGIGEDVIGKQRRKDAFDETGNEDES